MSSEHADPHRWNSKAERDHLQAVTRREHPSFRRRRDDYGGGRNPVFIFGRKRENIASALMQPGCEPSRICWTLCDGLCVFLMRPPGKKDRHAPDMGGARLRRDFVVASNLGFSHVSLGPKVSD